MDLHDSFATGRAHDPVMRGYVLTYHGGAPNHCPGCGRSHWHVGRTMAECAFCETALPLENSFRFSGLSRA
jgi:hypothetical protein